ncbi:MAG: glutathione S-transferase N-terminal domain-containing protein [Pseudomonadota bacterium]
MWRLSQFPLCPFSRKVRLMLGENAQAVRLEEVQPWNRQEWFLLKNPASETPVLEDTQSLMRCMP